MLPVEGESAARAFTRSLAPKEAEGSNEGVGAEGKKALFEGFFFCGGDNWDCADERTVLDVIR